MSLSVAKLAEHVIGCRGPLVENSPFKKQQLAYRVISEVYEYYLVCYLQNRTFLYYPNFHP